MNEGDHFRVQMGAESACHLAAGVQLLLTLLGLSKLDFEHGKQPFTTKLFLNFLFCKRPFETSAGFYASDTKCRYCT